MKKYNLTKSFKEISKNARSSAEKEKRRSVSLFRFVKSLVEYYQTNKEEKEVYEFLVKTKFIPLQNDLVVLVEREKDKKQSADLDSGIYTDELLENVLEMADTQRQYTGCEELGTPHFLLAMSLVDDKKDDLLLHSLISTFPDRIEIMKYFNLSIDPMNIPEERRLWQDEPDIKVSGPFPFNPFNMPGKMVFMGQPEEDKSEEGDILEKYAQNLTQKAKDGLFDPIVGREAEISQLIEVISCRKKNNCLLLGEPGVGKTSIIEGLCQRIVDGNVPIGIKDKKIYSLDLNSLVAGTKYRGEYEERLQKIIERVVGDKDIIMFIDEFHNLVGNGSSSKSGDGSNILKPYLSRGEFQCIGTTTSEEYRQIVEKDGALKRRFQNITVDQPDEEETIKILNNIKTKYQDYHGVLYSKEIIEKCVSLSGRYITDRFFPDKAIDVLDLLGSRIKLNSKSESLEAIEKLKDEISKKNEAAIAAINKDQRFDIASDLYDEIDEQKEKLEKLMSKKSNKIKAEEEILNSVISDISGVPVESIGKTDFQKLKDMKEVLNTVIIGQDEAILETVKALQRNMVGVRDPKKPMASFLCVGPTGCGKTYLAKTIAKTFFGSDEALIRFDMSEFSEKNSISKLTGTTAGYVGYEDAPLLEQIRKKPYSVVLFDEIEKADKSIYQTFMNILDEGSIRLGNGVKVDFKNTIILFTGNIGTKELSLRGSGLGFGGVEDKDAETQRIVNKAIEKEFAPELINRMSRIIVFKNLKREDIIKIEDLEIKKFNARIKQRGIRGVSLDKEAKAFIVDQCDLKYGARDLQRNITKYVEDTLCEWIIDNSGSEEYRKKVVKFGLNKDKTSIEILSE